MSNSSYQPRGLYFESFSEGQQIDTIGRTITEADIVNFAGISGDFNRIHTDADYATQDTFGQRVAHGLLVQSIATGLMVQSGIIEGTVLAFRELSCKFSQPIFIGDTIHVAGKIVGTKLLPRLGGGTIDIKYTVKNQHGKAVQKGNWIMLIKSEPVADTE